MSQRSIAEDKRDGPSTRTDDAAKPRLAKIRHSLRTPINHIIGYAEILQEDAAGAMPAAFLTDLEKIRSGGNALLALVNQQFSEDRFGVEADLRTVCHRLRTAVNYIIGYGEMLSEQCEEAEQAGLKADLSKIVAAGHAWLNLMEEHLDDAIELTLANPEAVSNTGQPSLDLRSHLASRELPDQVLRGLAGEHLLLADDDEANRDLLSRRLNKMGYRVTTCEDGVEALRLAGEIAPDLLLLDMVMPRLDGHQVLTRLKSDAALQHLPVIMISALDHVERVADCIELGAEDYLAKPFDPSLLRARVGAALEKKRLRDAEQIYLRQIEEERSRSDRLLLNILPQPIADRLKGGESHIVNGFDEVSVIFADLVGFTTLSTQISPTVLVRLLDRIFSAFDAIADRRGLEKIKTIGDAYMAAAGLPFPHDDHAAAAAGMALDMHEAIESFSHENDGVLKLRIGICTGPVIAGIIGQNKFSYDLWGDTVNTASRMESHGVPSRTQVDETTYDRLRGRFHFEERGIIDVKGKGPMKTYFLCPE